VTFTEDHNAHVVELPGSGVEAERTPLGLGPPNFARKLGWTVGGRVCETGGQVPSWPRSTGTSRTRRGSAGRHPKSNRMGL